MDQTLCCLYLDKTLSSTPMKLHWEAGRFICCWIIHKFGKHQESEIGSAILTTNFAKSSNLVIKAIQKYSQSHQRSSLDSWLCTHIQMYITFCTYWMGLSSTVLLDPHKSSCRYGLIIFLFSLLKNQGHRVRQSIVSLINDRCWTWNKVSI